MRLIWSSALLLIGLSTTGQKTIIIDSLFKQKPILLQVASHPNKYKPQIILTQVNTNQFGERTFTTSSYRAEDTEYFYPASVVKLPASIFAVEKMEKLSSQGVDLNTRISYDSSNSCQTPLLFDEYTNDSTPSIAEFIEKALVVSDNSAYSRLYEFVGPGYFYQRLKEMNMQLACIRHRFSKCDTIENRYTNQIYFLSERGDTLFTQPAAYFNGPYVQPMPHMTVGKSQIINGKTVSKPKDFSHSNALPLSNMHAFLMELIYPESQPFTYDITEEHRALIREALTICPKDARNKKIASNADFHDNYTNYLFFGNENKSRSSTLEVCNIVGLAYGFMTDIAYVKDPISGVEFFLSATLYTNASNKFGSGKYEYSTIGFPFMKEIAWTIHQELLD